VPLIGIAAALATAGVEALWYGLATKIHSLQVLEANLDLDYGPRPAVSILLCGFALAAVAGVRRWRQSRAVAA
jgi:sulfoxide reductase heme-binding subunit YedZ